MASPTTQTFRVELTEADDVAPITTSLQSFLHFSSKISLELDELELRFQHLSTPNSIHRDQLGQSR